MKGIGPGRYLRVQPDDEGGAKLSQRFDHRAAGTHVVGVEQGPRKFPFPALHAVVPAAEVDAHADGPRRPVPAVGADRAQHLIACRVLVDVFIGQVPP